MSRTPTEALEELRAMAADTAWIRDLQLRQLAS